jgi:secreted trypsin-like serine protease
MNLGLPRAESLHGGSTKVRTLVAASLLLSGLVALLPSAAAAQPASAGGVIAPRVIGGTTAAQGAWPSQAYVQTEVDSQSSGCGGTLIDPDWVLTAAHCVTDDNGDPVAPEAVFVVLGKQDLDEVNVDDFYDVAGIEVHPGWNPVTVRWDLALLRLATPSSQPAMSLIQPSQEPSTTGGKTALVAGWGCTSSDPGGCDDAAAYPAQLQEATVSFVSDSVCGSSRSWSSTFDPKMMICAGSYGSGTPAVCSGDSGGPLIAFAGGEKVLAGVTSFGSGDPLCIAKTRPAVFARVAAGRSWIDSTLGRRASLSGLRLTPSRKRVRAGARASFRIRLVNAGDAAGSGRIKLSIDRRRKATVQGYVTIGVDAGGSATRKVKVGTRRGRVGKVVVKARLGGEVARATLIIGR